MLFCKVKLKGKGKTYRSKKIADYNYHQNVIITNHQSKRAVLSASMTIEAAFIIPLFVFFVVALIYVINLLNFHGRVNTIIYDTARNTSKLEYNLEDSVSKAASLALFYAKISRINADKMGIAAGSSGMIPVYTDLEDECFKLSVNYVAKSPAGFLGIKPLVCKQGLIIRKWVGNEDKGGNNGTGTEKQKVMVYITDTGHVYHTNRNCTYLMLSVRTVDSSQLNNLRNIDGGKYYSCERCARGANASGVVYVTQWGDRYHINGNCSGLKRGVMTVPLESVAGWSKCSRCAAVH